MTMRRMAEWALVVHRLPRLIEVLLEMKKLGSSTAEKEANYAYHYDYLRRALERMVGILSR